MNLPPAIAALARLLRADIRQLIEATNQQVRAAHDATEAANKKAETPRDVVVSTPADKKLVVEVHPQDPHGQTTQASIKRATWIAAFGAWAAFLAAAIYAGIAVYQLREMRTQTKQIAKQFEAQQRAWVGNGEIKVKQATFFFYPDNPIQARVQINLDVDIPLRNVGASPALNVETWVLATASEQIPAPPSIEALMESACGGADRNAKSVGQVLFPNSPDTTVDWPMAVMTPFANINQVHRVWIDICVTYSGMTADRPIHHTKIWMASWPIDGQPKEIGRKANPKIIYYLPPIAKWGVIRTEAD